MSKVGTKLTIRIDWSELDLLGHINNVAYFKYIQAARINYWEQCGFSAMFHKFDIGPLLLSTTCRFNIPLFYPGNIVIETSIEFIKNTSYGMHHKIYNQNNEVAAEAHDVIVNFNFVKNEKSIISQEFKNIINKIGEN